jgi:AraC-like DNA-binding protein
MFYYNGMMDNRNIMGLSRIHPRVNISNYFTVKKDVNSWGPRILSDYEIILFRKGSYRYEESGRPSVDLNCSDILVIPPFCEHILYALDNNKTESAIACLHNDPVPSLANVTDSILLNPGIRRKTTLSPEDFLEADRLFKRSALLYSGNHPFRDDLLSSLCHQVWLIIGAYWGEGTGPEMGGRMGDMLIFIRENIHRNISRKDLAAEFSMTPEYVNALFKKELGTTPTALINREKVMRGYALLHNEGLSVKETAYKCGFIDEYYFSRVFRKILGFSPGTAKGKDGSLIVFTG